MTNQQMLRLKVGTETAWTLSVPSADKYLLVNEYLGYLADRNYSPRTLRAYGYDLLAFCHWLEQKLAANSSTRLSCRCAANPC